MDTVMFYQDAGITDTLLAHLADTTYSNATLTSELLNHSFLSDTVMNAACARTPFFSEVQFQSIAVSNSPVTAQVWPFLKNALAGIAAKNAAYVDTILSAQAVDTLRTLGLIEKEMRQAEKQRFWAINEMVAHYAASDTVADSTYALIHFLADSLPDRKWRRLAVGVAFETDTLSWARSILDSLPMETTDDSVFYDYHDLAISLREDTLTWFDMDSTQRAFIDTVAAGSSTLKLRAQAVQSLLTDSVFARLPEHIPYTPSFRRTETESPPEPMVASSKVNVYPNPFSNQFNVAWELESEQARLQFEVFDLTGRLIHAEQVSVAKTGQHVLNLGPCQGFYILRVSENGQQLFKQKLLCLGE